MIATAESTSDKRDAHKDLVKRNQDNFDEQGAKDYDDAEHIAVSRESYATLKKHLGTHLHKDNTRVLNFGCGTGLMEEQLRHDVKQIVGVDVSTGMIERVRHKIEGGHWDNVEARQMDILEDEGTQQLQKEGFDLALSCYVFHHLHDVVAIGKQIVKCIKPGGYFCMIDFAAGDEHKHKFDENLSEATKASIGTHDGFSREFLVDFFQEQLGLTDARVHPACPLKCGEEEYPTTIAYGMKA